MLGTGTGCLFFCREQALFFCTIAVPKLHIRCTSLSNSTVIAMLYFSLRILFFSSGKTVGEKSVFNNFNALMGLSCYLLPWSFAMYPATFQCPHGLELLLHCEIPWFMKMIVSMPSRAWVVTRGFLEIQTLLCRFNALTGLSCYWTWSHPELWAGCFNALTGLSCYQVKCMFLIKQKCFNALTGLSCYQLFGCTRISLCRFNALTGLSCYSKNVQYFKFFMILFMHTCYL